MTITDPTKMNITYRNIQPVGRLFHEKEMYEQLAEYAVRSNLRETEAALDYAKRMHEGQYRRGGDRVPFFIHPLNVACHTIALGLGDDTAVAAALLHDVCEDCNLSAEELPFSEPVKTIVSLLTRSYPKEDLPNEKENHYYQAISQNKTASMIKIIDRCHNISTMASGFAEHRIQRYIKDTKTYVYPLIEHTKEQYPEYKNQLFLLKYHMESVIQALESIQNIEGQV